MRKTEDCDKTEVGLENHYCYFEIRHILNLGSVLLAKLRYSRGEQNHPTPFAHRLKPGPKHISYPVVYLLYLSYVPLEIPALHPVKRLQKQPNIHMQK